MKISNSTGTITFGVNGYELKYLDYGTCEAISYKTTPYENGSITRYNTRLGERKIKISGSVISTISQMNSRKRIINKMCNPPTQFTLTDNEFKIECVASKTVFFSPKGKSESKVVDFEIEAYCLTPFWYTNPSNFSFRNCQNVCTEYQNALAVTNVGDVETGFKAEIEIVLPVSYFQISLEGKRITVDKELYLGNVITIDTRDKVKTVTFKQSRNATETNIIDRVRYDSEFFNIPVGTSYLFYEFPSGSANINVTIDPRYMR